MFSAAFSRHRMHRLNFLTGSPHAMHSPSALRHATIRRWHSVRSARHLGHDQCPSLGLPHAPHRPSATIRRWYRRCGLTTTRARAGRLRTQRP